MLESTPSTDPIQNAGPTTAARNARSGFIRFAFTFVPFFIYLLAERFPLPTVVRLELVKDSLEAYSIVAVGIMPWIIGAVMVEIVAMVVPEWQELRHSGTVGRAKLWRAANIFGFVLALFHAAWITITLIFTPTIFDPNDPDRYVSTFWGPKPYASSPPLVFITLIGGALFVRLLAEVVTRRGLVHGYVVFFAGSILLSTIRTILRLMEVPEAMDVLLLAWNALLCSGLLIWVVQAKHRSAR